MRRPRVIAGPDAKIKEPILPCAQTATGLDEVPRDCSAGHRKIIAGLGVKMAVFPAATGTQRGPGRPSCPQPPTMVITHPSSGLAAKLSQGRRGPDAKQRCYCL